ncbi:MAG: N-methyl-L-tryptophan oxidase [Candidatus Limnocylindrales bacterium]
MPTTSGASILTRTGGLYAGSPGSALVTGALGAARTHAVGHEVIDADEIRRRWPAFTPADEMVGLVEAQAGVIRADRANATHLAVAERAGAELRFGAQVVEWRPVRGGGVEVVVAGRTVVAAERLVLTAGPWLGDLVPDMGLPLAVERQPVCWFAPAVPAADVALGRLPIWLFDTQHDGTYYGFPHDPELGLKVSHHHSGEVVGPDAVDRDVRRRDVERVRRFIRARMPVADGPLISSTVCLYTNTPDAEFIVDVHPTAPGVAFASACSGHGFKFAPLIGEILADLVMDNATSWPIDAFRAARFGP